MEWPIHEVARRAGTTSRTLRHYGDIGLLDPTRVGSNGYRYYDDVALVRLQRILLLRELGLGLPVIAEVLAKQTDVAAALDAHVEWLRQEKGRIDRQIASVQRTRAHLIDGGQITMDAMLDGFDHTRYEGEVRERWGDDAWEGSTRWWDALSPEDKKGFAARSARVNGALRELAEAGSAPEGNDFQDAVAAHHDWLAGQPGPMAERDVYLSLADMYVADERFAATYGGVECATRVRDAIVAWAQRNL